MKNYKIILHRADGDTVIRTPIDGWYALPLRRPGRGQNQGSSQSGAVAGPSTMAGPPKPSNIQEGQRTPVI